MKELDQTTLYTTGGSVPVGYFFKHANHNRIWKNKYEDLLFSLQKKHWQC